MRRAVGFFAVFCSIASLGTALGQEAVDPASTPGQFLEQLQDAPVLPTVDVAPPPAPELQDAPLQPLNDAVPQDAAELTDEEDYILGKGLQFEAAIIHLESAEDFSEEELAVAGDTVDAMLQDWKANGKVTRMSVVRLTSVDRHEGFVTIGEQVPVTTGRTSFGGGRGGPFQNSVSYQDVGTVFGVRGQIEGDRIAIECNVEESRLASARPAPAPPVEAVEGAPTAQAEPDQHAIQKVNSETVLSVVDGGKAIVSASFQKTAVGSRATIVTLKASILQ